MATPSNRGLEKQPINNARPSPSFDESQERGTGGHSSNGQALHEGVLPGFETPGTFAERPGSAKEVTLGRTSAASVEAEKPRE